MSSSTSQQSITDPIKFLLEKPVLTQQRKGSDLETRDNFVLKHEAQQYTVVRVYINSFQSSQIKLYYSKFTPRAKLGTICIIHGYGQSSDDYLETAAYFARRGYVINLIDLRGFGYSGGARGQTKLKNVMSDIENLLRRCCEMGLPTYVMAHGYGATMVLGLLQQNANLPIAGVIALSPLFTFPFQSTESYLLQLLLWLDLEIFHPVLLSNHINPTSLTDNPAKIQKNICGVFSIQYLTFKMASEYIQLSRKVRRDAVKFTYPILICYGGKNSLQPIHQVKKFYKEISSQQKSSILHKRGYHQLHNDIEAQEHIFPRILEWITDPSSPKNSVKWSKTGSFNLQVLGNRNWWKIVAGAGIFAMISLLLGIIKIIKAKKCTK